MLDMRTLMITYVMNSLINTIVMAIYWRQNRHYFNGIGLWVFSLILQTLGFLLVGTRGLLPDLITIVLSNFIIVAASLIIFESFKKLVGRQTRNLYNYFFLMLYLLLQYYFTFTQPSTSARIVLISVFVSIMFFQSGKLLLNSKVHDFKPFTKITGNICYVYVLVQIYRITVELFTPTADYLAAGFSATLAQLINQFLTIAIVFSFIIMVNSINLHNRLKAQEELSVAKQKAEDANKAKSNFLSKMSHELRTPLNSIITLSGVLSRSLPQKVSQEELSYVDVIEQGGKNLLEMINDILDIARIESGRVEVFVEYFSLNEIIDSILSFLEPLAKVKHIELIFEKSFKEIGIESDQKKIMHIFQNLISNAIKFTDEGYVKVTTGIEGDFALISVADTGIGIKSELIAHIFEEFNQLDSSLSAKHGGSGLGLAIAKQYTDMLGGTIQVVSTPGKGSVFTVKLPLLYSQQNDIAI